MESKYRVSVLILDARVQPFRVVLITELPEKAIWFSKVVEVVAGASVIVKVPVHVPLIVSVLVNPLIESFVYPERILKVLVEATGALAVLPPPPPHADIVKVNVSKRDLSSLIVLLSKLKGYILVPNNYFL